MCTAATYQTDDFYMGRTLDYEFSYGEEITVMPRRFPLEFRHGGRTDEHYAMIGTAHVSDGYPMYYDAVNEKGLGMAGLNFAVSAHYAEPQDGKQNIAQFEFIPWVLSRCADMSEVRACLSHVSVLAERYNDSLPLQPLHWMISWQDESIVVESVADGLHICENPVGVMTNNPPFETQLFGLNNYMSLSPVQPENAFAPGLPMTLYSNGMGALGLPGDLSSASRFVRVAYTKMNSACGDSEAESVNQFFHILGSVAMTRGAVLVHGKPEITIYSCCCNADTGVYYYTTYENSRITGVDMHREDLDGDRIVRFPLEKGPQILMAN